MHVVFLGYLIRPPDKARTDPARYIADCFESGGPTAAFDQNGVYAALVYDGRSSALHVGIDRHGVFPLFLGRDGETWWIGNSLRTVVSRAPASPDFEGLEELVTIGSCLDGRTPYRGVRRLEYAQYTTLRESTEPCVRRYWSVDELPEPTRTDRVAFWRESSDIFEGVVADLASRMEQPLCLLSSGYDSRRIHLELERQKRPHVTATVEIPLKSLGGAESIERAVVERVVGGESTDRLFFDPPRIDELPGVLERADRDLQFLSTEHVWIYPLLDGIEPGRFTNLDGLAGDTLFNNPFFSWSRHADKYGLAGRELARVVADPAIQTYLADSFRSGLDAALSERLGKFLDELPANPNRLSIFCLMARTARSTAMFAERVLSRRFESVAPYLDRELVDHAFSFSPQWKESNAGQRLILAARYPARGEVVSSHSPRAELGPELRRDLSFLRGPEHRGSYWQCVEAEAISHSLGVLAGGTEVNPYLNVRGHALIRLARLWNRWRQRWPALARKCWAIPQMAQMAGLLRR